MNLNQYPNLEAIIQGTIAGHFDNWGLGVRPELIELLAEVERLEAGGLKYKNALDKATEETMRLSNDHAFCGDYWLTLKAENDNLREALEIAVKHLKVYYPNARHIIEIMDKVLKGE